MKISREELNIIMAAHRLSEFGFAQLSDMEKDKGNQVEANRHADTSLQCKMLADRFAERGLAFLTLSQSEFNLVVAVLRLNGGMQTLIGRDLLAAGGENAKPAAQEKEIFATACRAVADKWERLGLRGVLH